MAPRTVRLAPGSPWPLQQVVDECRSRAVSQLLEHISQQALRLGVVRFGKDDMIEDLGGAPWMERATAVNLATTRGLDGAVTAQLNDEVYRLCPTPSDEP